MLENLNPVTLSGKAVPTTKSIQYFGNSSDYFNDSRTPEIAEVDYAKTPSTVLQAKQAVALAKYAGAQRDALEELQAAETLMNNAENAWKAGRREDEVDITARQAIGAAVKAEDTAAVRRDAREKRNERSRQDAELRRAEDKYEDALQQIENLKGELAREQRGRELAERDSQTFTGQMKELRDENVKLRVELERLKNEIEDLRSRAAKAETDRQAAEQRQQEQDRINRLQSAVPGLIQSLKAFGPVRQDQRGIILTLAESYWTGARLSSFVAANEPKLNGLANVLAGAPDYKIVIESHTDNRGTPEELQSLTSERAQAIGDKLASQGIESARIETKGYGASLPIAPNTTLTNRAKNRRVDVILVPNF
jgi:outer membrane protein OmpA-like peptidoglycan-associated protein